MGIKQDFDIYLFVYHLNYLDLKGFAGHIEQLHFQVPLKTYGDQKYRSIQICKLSKYCKNMRAIQIEHDVSECSNTSNKPIQLLRWKHNFRKMTEYILENSESIQIFQFICQNDLQDVIRFFRINEDNRLIFVEASIKGKLYSER